MFHNFRYIQQRWLHTQPFERFLESHRTALNSIPISSYNESFLLIYMPTQFERDLGFPRRCAPSTKPSMRAGTLCGSSSRVSFPEETPRNVNTTTRNVQNRRILAHRARNVRRPGSLLGSWNRIFLIIPQYFHNCIQCDITNIENFRAIRKIYITEQYSKLPKRVLNIHGKREDGWDFRTLAGSWMY